MTEQTTSDVLLLETGMDYDELTEAAPAEVAALETNATEVEAESAEINDDAELSMRLAINNLYRKYVSVSEQLERSHECFFIHQHVRSCINSAVLTSRLKMLKTMVGG